jgi:hypothetical protein
MHKEMFNILSHKGNANQNDTEILSDRNKCLKVGGRKGTLITLLVGM